MIVGMTGTREGLSAYALDELKEFVKARKDKITEAHHGDCVGADAQFHQVMIDAGIPVYIHPPLNPKRRAYCEGATKVFEPRSYLSRNKQIVRSCTRLLAFPRSTTEEQRSGTWSTIRYARKVKTGVKIIYPKPQYVHYSVSRWDSFGQGGEVSFERIEGGDDGSELTEDYVGEAIFEKAQHNAFNVYVVYFGTLA